LAKAIIVTIDDKFKDELVVIMAEPDRMEAEN
jgi:hypothetical protein